MEKIKKAVGLGPPEEERGILNDIDDGCTLTWSTRIKCFIGCFVLGFIISILANITLFLGSGFSGFALLYTIGNICSLASTCFLMGPIKQIKNMFAETRIFATITVLVFMILTILSAVLWKLKGLCFLFCILQFLALLWYSLSYIPYARNIVKKCFGSMV